MYTSGIQDTSVSSRCDSPLTISGWVSRSEEKICRLGVNTPPVVTRTKLNESKGLRERRSPPGRYTGPRPVTLHPSSLTPRETGRGGGWTLHLYFTLHPVGSALVLHRCVLPISTDDTCRPGSLPPRPQGSSRCLRTSRWRSERNIFFGVEDTPRDKVWWVAVGSTT